MADRGCFPCSAFRIYNTVNVFRYLLMGLLIFMVNDNKHSKVNKYDKYCCSCYQISLNATIYGLASDTAFDLSNCIPDCTTCNYCKNHTNIATVEVNATKSCPVGNYTRTLNTWIQWDWRDETGCPDNIHLSSLIFFGTNYEFTAWTSILVSIIYSVILIIFIYLNATQQRFKLALDTCYMVITLYNISFSAIFLYLLFIPFHFYHENIPFGNHSVTCEIDAISEVLETAVTVEIFTGIGLILLLFVINLVLWCPQCRRQRVDPPLMSMDQTELSSDLMQDRRDSLSSAVASDIHDFQDIGTEAEFGILSIGSSIRSQCCDAIKHPIRRRQLWIWFCVGTIAIIFILSYTGIILCALIEMIKTGSKHKQYDENQPLMMVIIFVLLLSTLDLVFWNIDKFCIRRRHV